MTIDSRLHLLTNDLTHLYQRLDALIPAGAATPLRPLTAAELAEVTRLTTEIEQLTKQILLTDWTGSSMTANEQAALRFRIQHLQDLGPVAGHEADLRSTVAEVRVFLASNGLMGHGPEAEALTRGNVGDSLFAGIPCKTYGDMQRLIDNPTFHPHWIKFYEQMHAAYPHLPEQTIKEAFQKILCGIQWNLLKAATPPTLVEWARALPADHRRDVFDSFIAMKIAETRAAAVAAASAAAAMPGDAAAAQIAVTEAATTRHLIEAAPANQRKDLRKELEQALRDAPPTTAAPAGAVEPRLDRSADLYADLQQRVLPHGSREENPFFHFGLETLEFFRGPEEAYENTSAATRGPALWGGGIEVSDLANKEGFEVLERSRVGQAFNGVVFHPQWNTYVPLWDELSHGFALTHIAQQLREGANPPILHMFVRADTPGSIGRRIELPTTVAALALAVHPEEVAVGEVHVVLHLCATSSDGKTVMEMAAPIDVHIDMEKIRKDRAGGISPEASLLGNIYLSMSTRIRELQQTDLTRGSKPLTQQEIEERRFLNANLFSINNTRFDQAKADAAAAGTPEPVRDDLRPLPLE